MWKANPWKSQRIFSIISFICLYLYPVVIVGIFLSQNYHHSRTRTKRMEFRIQAKKIQSFETFFLFVNSVLHVATLRGWPTLLLHRWYKWATGWATHIVGTHNLARSQVCGLRSLTFLCLPLGLGRIMVLVCVSVCFCLCVCVTPTQKNKFHPWFQINNIFNHCR